ncbi:MAG: pantoate--beta-alanine ligase [Mariprofundales bacterium]|nr:pantoate--beta-alanine ligase [Mariprofundales bacterium]
MQFVVDQAQLAVELAPLHAAGRVALVATMGALHGGHLALIREARERADVVVVSIYVNPRQFGAGEDYHRYPRSLEQDRELCADMGVELLFAPDSLYRDGGARLSMVVDASLSGCLCGAGRPGHFDGVATVVAILFNLVRPDVALFGEKDWQQLQVIRALVEDLLFPVEIIGVATRRERSGLAMSSRNLNLTSGGLVRAARIHTVLSAMRKRAEQGERMVVHLEAAAMRELAQDGIRVEYLQVRHEQSLCLVDEVSAGCRIFIAAYIDGVRLIDNMPLL